MKRKRFTEEQIIRVLKGAEAGPPFDGGNSSAVDLIPKPFDMDWLLASIERFTKDAAAAANGK